MSILVFALLLGVVSGLRAMTAPAVVSWAAYKGLLSLTGTPLAFMGYHYTPYIFTLLAIGELINDKLPATPSRKVPPQFIARVVSGGLVGGTVGASANALILGVVAGAVGAVLGTLGGSAVRGKLGAVFGKDLPAALLEDVVAIGLAIAVVSRF
jgi:uncharacterized membrane protein